MRHQSPKAPPHAQPRPPDRRAARATAAARGDPSEDAASEGRAHRTVDRRPAPRVRARPPDVPAPARTRRRRQKRAGRPGAASEALSGLPSGLGRHRGIRGPKVTAKVTGRRRRRHPCSCASPPDARRLMLTLTIDTAASGRARPAPPARAPLPWRLARTATRAHRRTRPTRRPRPLPRAAPVRRRRPRTRTSGKGMPSCAS